LGGHTYISKESDRDGFVKWTNIENETWSKLIARQNEVAKTNASEIFLDGLEKLNFPNDRVPQIPDINKTLKELTGWSVVPVPALIHPSEFYALLADKKFPAATFIRIPEELDYIEEPDIFHEIYGHTPLLCSKEVTDFMYDFGKLAEKADKKHRRRLFRLFWFSIEFGMIRENEKLKALGAGILSSIGETKYCLTDKPVMQDFVPEEVVRTPYRIDIMQPLYFVLDNIYELAKALKTEPLAMIEQAITLGDHTPLFESKGKTLDTDSGAMEDHN
jgi:phenylalanine-4-hydroxylase